MTATCIRTIEARTARSGRLVIWGASGHALNVIDIVRANYRFEVVGLIDDIEPDRAGDNFDGFSILGGRDKLSGLLAEGANQIFLAFGCNAARLELAELVEGLGFTLVTLIHSRATVAESVTIGPGTYVGAVAVIDPFAKIGANVIVHTASVVSHECVVEDGASLAPGVCMGGGTRVGYGAQIGIGATLRDHISIGAGSVIGAGAVVVKDVPAGVMAYGVPARVISSII
jgi:UDP-N-acetylbacillosamine N-acetyltransferase